ncbi:flagellar hook-length control protein FliK [Kordiimonas aestuarii]|uniref:flagellar hook-length control protein FliK n=1 Tax=Kordiimonas aestuarii TaxID=1005925 RepID=UPI0021D1194F|nr:flagellar hook-length control protein FliK [Kordiimonas aestuarii]
MNPIDQMMQAQGVNSSQAAAALFGSQPTTEGQESGFAALFGNLIQSFQADGAKTATSPDDIQTLEELSPAQAEFLTALGVTIPAEQKPASFQGDLGVFSSSGNSAVTQEVNFAKVLPAALVQLNIATTEGGAAKLETAELPLSDIASLPEGAKSDLLNALQGMVTSGKIPALTLTAPSGEAHILPVSELAALINASQAPADQAAVTIPAGTLAPAGTATPDGTATAPEGAAPLAEAPTQTAAQTTPPPTDIAPEGTPATSAAPAQSSETLAAGLVNPAPPAADAIPQDPAQAVAAAVSNAAADAADDTASTAVAAQAANASKQPTVQADSAQQKPADQAQNMADGYMVAANQQQNTASQNNTGQSAKKPANANVLDKVAPALGEDSKTAPARGEALTARPVDPVAARPETLPQMNATRDLSLTMTPERLAGLPDGSASDIVATGLSGMRGDGGFMASMSLLGGHASRGLQGHVAKQLNMSVSKAVKAGEQEFTMRLDPAELGRVQVKLRFMDGGRVHAQVTAERPETLELLQRDARGLERAIDANNAKGQGATIEFSLDQGNQQESAGKAFAEAVQQEKMRDELAARSAGGHAAGFTDKDAGTDDVPLDDILPYVDAETGLDIRV